MTTPPMLPTPPALPTTLLPPPKPLDTSRDAWLGWKTRKSEFELFSTATQLNKQPKEVQVATLLVTIGEEARKVFALFKFEPGEDTTDVTLIIKKFEDFYQPTKNLTYHEFCFGSRDQKEDESFNDWLVELRTLAQHCDFEDLEERMLRSRIILGIRDKGLQKKLISENPSYQRVVEICRIQEQGEKQFRQIRGTTEGAETAAVNALARVTKPCNKCGYKVHRGSRCPATGKACKKCGGLNHFAQACSQSSFLHSEDAKHREIRELHVDERSDFFLEALTVNALASDQWTATVSIEGRPMVCKLDTGANCCLISKEDVLSLPRKTPEAFRATLSHVKPAETRVFSATKRLRSLKLSLSVNDKQHDETFFVIEQNVPVTLSGAAAESLGLIYRVDSVETQQLYPAAQPFADVFTGLGQLKNFECEMKLKPGAVGVVVPARRVPVAIEEKVKAELERMEEHNVITKEQVRYLGHVFTTQGLSLGPDRVQAILDMPAPSNTSERRLEELRVATAKDPALSTIRSYAETDWPENKEDVPACARSFWEYQEEMHTQDGLVFRSNKVTVPSAKSAEILRLLHLAHSGAEKMKIQARSVMFWPSMSSDIDQVAASCKVCQAHQKQNTKMPLLSHDVPSLPWEMVGMDLFHHGGKEFALIVDFYSFYFEIKDFRYTTARHLKEWCAKVFSVHGLPVKLCSDNGPPFSSQEFREFLHELGVTHVTSSPYHPRANGMAERAVQEAKTLLNKCSYNSPDFHLAMLELRNTPRDAILMSPVQRLMGRQTRTLLPVPSCHLKPAPVPNRKVHSRLQEIRHKQKVYYNRGARDLRALSPGQRASSYDTHTRTWSPVVVLGSAGAPRSVLVKTEDGREMRRTREHLREVPELPCPDTTTTPSSGLPGSGPVPEPPLPRRSTLERREPRRYPMPERPILPQGKEDVTELARPR
ncbi:uncharacterized protein LOC142814703 isoform X1 [Rhipicephalus microplus]|uniref:uncharacterized protein LOC142814703 isoform X1 n=1 Tax=Rhipicephalus microplus TaxID=6941 RepID=UPI003F6A796E